MPDTRVLVVDDSLTMRALISRALDSIPGVAVVGTASGADEARSEREQLHPDVMTLDIEMPGMNGIEYLGEIMDRKPMPVIMFSTLTEAGAQASVEALKLGAVDCFPKPKAASQAEFDKVLGRLAKCIKNAKNGAVRRIKVQAPVAAFEPNGRLLVIGADASSTQGLFDLLAAFPANCPPTIVVQHVRADLLDSVIAQLDERAACRVVKAVEGAVLEPGTVHVAGPAETHMIVDKWPGGQLRAFPRDPIAGERPSISLLFAAAAKCGAGETVGMLLTCGGEDGLAGVKALLGGGGHVVAAKPEAGPGLYLSKGLAAEPLGDGQIASTVLRLCGK